MIDTKKLRAAKVPFEIVAGKVVVGLSQSEAIDPITDDVVAAIKSTARSMDLEISNDNDLEGSVLVMVTELFGNGILRS